MMTYITNSDSTCRHQVSETCHY